MRIGLLGAPVFVATALRLAGCSTSGHLAGSLSAKNSGADGKVASSSSAEPATTGAIPPLLGVPTADEPGLLGSDPHDDLALGKKQYRAGNFGLAEQHFRHAVELHPRDAEAWLGLAAAYDELRRFDLADRAYKEATRILGPTAEILNNEGYSYMLRGNYKRARAKLLAAKRKDPNNKYVANNLKLLQKSYRQGKSIE
jgi:tetratricopeptide (TPR) repeat protein